MSSISAEPRTTFQRSAEGFLAYYVELADRVGDLLDPTNRRTLARARMPESPDQANVEILAEARAVLEAEYPNLLECLAACARRHDDGHLLELLYPLTEFLLDRGDHGVLMDWANEAVQAARRLRDPSAEAIFHTTIAHLWTSAGTWQEALNSLAAARALHQALEDSERLAWNAYHVAGINTELSDWANAVDGYRSAQVMFEELDDYEGKSSCMTSLGIVALRCGQTDEALRTLSAALEMAELEGDTVGIAVACNNLAVLYSRIGDLDRAEALYRREWDIADQSLDLPGKAITSLHMGSLAIKRGRLEEAVQQLEIAEEVFEEAGDVFRLLEVRDNLALAYERLGHLVTAKRLLLQTARSAEAVGNWRQLTRACDRLGDLDRAADNLAESVEWYERERKLAQEHDDVASLIRAHNGLGAAHRKDGAIELAIDQYSRAVELEQQVGQASAWTQITLAELFNQAGEKDRSAQHFRCAIDIAGDGEHNAVLGWAFTGLGRWYERASDWQQAAEFHHQALSVWLSESDRENTGFAYANLARALRRLDKHEEAITAIEAELEIWTGLRMARRRARARSDLGDVRSDAGDLPGAIEDYLAAVEIYEETKDLDAVPYLIWRVLCLGSDLGDYSQVVSTYRKATELGLEDVEPLDWGDVHLLVADALAEYSNWGPAADHYRTALRRYEVDGSAPAIANAALGLAKASAEVGDRDEETRAFGQALAASCELVDRSFAGWITIFLGSAHRRHGELELAVSRYEEACEIFDGQGDIRGLASTHRNLGWTHVQAGNLAAAVSAFGESMALFDRVADKQEVADLRYLLEELHAS